MAFGSLFKLAAPKSNLSPVLEASITTVYIEIILQSMDIYTDGSNTSDCDIHAIPMSPFLFIDVGLAGNKTVPGIR